MQLRLPIPDFSIIITTEGATGSQLTGLLQHLRFFFSYSNVIYWSNVVKQWLPKLDQ